MSASPRRVLPKNLIELLKGRRYSLRGYRIMPVGARGLFGHDRLAAFVARAEDVDLCGNRIADVGLHALSRSPIAASVTSLDLSDCDITPAGLPLLSAFPKLEVLSLSHNALGAAGARALAELDLSTRLLEVQLAGTGIGSEGLGALRRRLSADHLDLGHAGLEGDLGDGEGQVLRPRGSLFLGGNALGDEGARALAAWGVAPAQLSLQWTGLGDDGLAALDEAGVFASASYVDLRGNALGIEAVRAVDWAERTIVKLGGDRLSAEDVAGLRRERPDLGLMFDAVEEGFVLLCPYCRHPHGLDSPLCPHCGGDVSRDASIEVVQGERQDPAGACHHCDAELLAGAMRCASCQSWVPTG